MTKIEKTLIKRIRYLEKAKLEYLGGKEVAHNLSHRERSYLKELDHTWQTNYNLLKYISPNFNLDQ